jgi:hypothetical protein
VAVARLEADLAPSYNDTHGLRELCQVAHAINEAQRIHVPDKPQECVKVHAVLGLAAGGRESFALRRIDAITLTAHSHVRDLSI